MFFLHIFYLFGVVSGRNSFPKPLNADEEAMYIEDYLNGDEETSRRARDILIERNLRLVAHVVKKYGNYNKDGDDLISIGTIGLIKAISTFKPVKNTRLATYAARCIDNAMVI